MEPAFSISGSPPAHDLQTRPGDQRARRASAYFWREGVRWRHRSRAAAGRIYARGALAKAGAAGISILIQAAGTGRSLCAFLLAITARWRSLPGGSA
jgi:hypothetical protein